MINTELVPEKDSKSNAQAWVQFGILLLDSWAKREKQSDPERLREQGGARNINNNILAKKPAKYQRVKPELQAIQELRPRVMIYIPTKWKERGR